ncbi:MAG: peptidase T [Eubacteriales bacterium]|nr:peptidase T [Eubacteriales bacterium]
MKTIDRFLKYISIETESNEKNDAQTPSTDTQWELARVLVEELKELGIEDAHTNEFCTVYAHIPATPGYEDQIPFGFMAHIDTVPNGKGIKPRLIEHYDGEDVVLESGVKICVKEHPHLPSLKGRTLVVTDGTTILGADDKAGVAVIMSMCERIVKENIPHGRICIAFTPDEEIGTGVDKFDLKEFDATFAVTVDGGAENCIEAECFNAASAKVKAEGVETHPGSAKNIMVNAVKILAEFTQLLPKEEIPEKTEDREGFYHLLEMSGDVEHASASYILRDFEKESQEKRKQMMRELCEKLNEKYGREVLTLEIKDSYYNMYEVVKQYPELLKNIEKAIENTGMTPEYLPIRGGTDGCRLSFEGLPCPNLGAGAYGFHGFHEHCTVEGLENSVNMMLELVKLYAVCGR